MKNHKQSHTKKFIIIGLVAVVAVSGGILTYVNRQKVRDFLSSEQSTATDQNTAALEERGINDVDYGPSAPTDNEQINEQKKNADTPPPPTVPNGVVATITNTRVVNNLAQVSVLVEGTTTGTCKLSLKGSAGQNVTKNTSVVLKGGLYTCEDFNIPVAELSSGTWNATIIIDVNGTSSAEATGTLQIGT